MSLNNVFKADKKLSSLYFRALASMLVTKKNEYKQSVNWTCFDQRRTDLNHLKRYASLCGFELNNQVPVTYPHVLAFRAQLSLLTSNAFVLPVIGLIHTRNRITQLKPIPLQCKIDIRCFLNSPIKMPKGIQNELITEVSIDGETVWHSSSFFLYRKNFAEDELEGKPEPIVLPERAKWRSTDWLANASVGRNYAKLSGDYNPIHLSAWSAKFFGFKQAIAHGMWTKAKCIGSFRAIAQEFKTIDVQFKKPLFLPGVPNFQTSTLNHSHYFFLATKNSDIQYLVGKADL